MSNLPHPNDSIGVFDSGLGGLSVLKSLQQLLPHENFLYLADTARIPYGNKANSTVERYAEQCCRFLEQKQVKLIVIACHTVSSVALSFLKGRFSVPMIGMIEPSLMQINSLLGNQKLALLGTRRTIDAGIYESAISDIETISSVHCFPCPLFVPLVEEGHIADEMSDLIVRKTLAPLLDLELTSIFLGCTHFPFLIQSMRKIAPHIPILDPAESVALATQKVLTDLQIANPSTEKGTTSFFVTDDPNRFSSFKAQLISSKEESVELAILP